MPIELWLFATAVVFTFLGIYFGRNGSVEHTIDTLIAAGYLRTRRKGKDGEIEILNWNDLSE